MAGRYYRPPFVNYGGTRSRSGGGGGPELKPEETIGILVGVFIFVAILTWVIHCVRRGDCRAENERVNPFGYHQPIVPQHYVGPGAPNQQGHGQPLYATPTASHSHSQPLHASQSSQPAIIRSNPGSPSRSTSRLRPPTPLSTSPHPSKPDINNP